MLKTSKGLRLSLALLAVFLILAGCGKTASNSTDKTGNSDSANKAKNAQGGGQRMPDFGQPQRPADIRGIVKSIVGNEVDILKVDLGQGRRASSTTNGTDSGSSTRSAITLSLGGNGGEAAVRGNGGGGRPGGFGGPGGPDSQTATSRATMLAELKKLSTGEDKVVIPVGIQMLKSSVNASAKKREMVEASLSDITPDKTITIWLNTQVTDKKVAEFVLIN